MNERIEAVTAVVTASLKFQLLRIKVCYLISQEKVEEKYLQVETPAYQISHLKLIVAFLQTKLRYQ